MLWWAAKLDHTPDYLSASSPLSKDAAIYDTFHRLSLVTIGFLVLAGIAFWIVARIISIYTFDDKFQPTSSPFDESEEPSLLTNQSLYRNLKTSTHYLRRASFAQ